MRVLSALAAVMLAPACVLGQARPPAAGGITASLGQPRSVQWTGAASFAWEDGAGGQAAFGGQRDLLSPLLSLAAIHGEVYAQAGRGDLHAGARVRLVSPVARFGVGADFRTDRDMPDVLLSAFHPIRRGGLFHDASLLRVDWVPARDHAFSVGIEKPVLGKARLGRSRPRADRVTLPSGHVPHVSIAGNPAVTAALSELRSAAERVRVLNLPLGPASGGAAPAADVTREIAPVVEALRMAAAATAVNGGDAEPPAVAAVRAYHDALARAFCSAAGTSGACPQGAEAAAAARSVLLADVLLPYNRLLGQAKRRDDLGGMAAVAFARFERWVHAESSATPETRHAITAVFGTLLRIVEETRAASRAQWRDSRFVWLPLQLALLPEQHDSQEELDAIIEAAVGVRFTEGNVVSYVVNEQFQYHLARTIREARDYHVLWTHDFRGVDGGGQPDEMAFRHVLNSYLSVLTQRVREYDRTGRLPVYMIIMDQWFYEVNDGRRWMTLLEDPLRHTVQLPPGHAAWQDSLAGAQAALREAVAASALLQQQAARFGEKWLHGLVKIHVNITNPADPSFWSTRVIRHLPLPDNMMRDHRKMVFYDITESDPYRGEAMFTGAGVGEHYANLSWEDRSLLVRGPALLPLKEIARRHLIHQGIPAADIPPVLRPTPLAADYEARIGAALAEGAHVLRALQVHNGAGFDDKEVNVVKAVLYTLMPPGSVIKIPDSLWNGELWASALLGAALRGGRVMIIAPAADNAPAVVMGTLGRSREVLGRTLTAARALDPEIVAAGGTLRVGLFHSDLQVTDMAAKLARVRNAFAEHAWLRDLFGFPEHVLAEVAIMDDQLSRISMAPHPFAEFEFDPQPKLHLKANFFASREAWTLMSRPEWASTAWAYLQTRTNQVQNRPSAVLTFEAFPDALHDPGGGMIADWRASLDEDARSRIVFYALMGSHNQNHRSLVIDAEVGFLISAWPAVIPYLDLIVIIGQTRWADTADELAPYLPLDQGWRRRLAHWVRLAL